MRQQTPDWDLESLSKVASFEGLRKKGTEIGVANLGGIGVFVLEVDGASKSLSHWQSLREFWIEYFRASGARLVGYTVLRDLTIVVTAPDPSH